MKEVLSDFSPTYRDCFLQMESAAKENGCSTIDAYKMYNTFLDDHSLDPTIYLSMAITSGGYKRDEQLDIMDVIRSNSAFGTEAVNAFIKQFPQFDKTDIVLPSDLGKMQGWSQGDYLLYWFHVISGVDTQIAEEIEAQIRTKGILEAPGFSDNSLPEEKRWNAYQSLVEAYTTTLDALTINKKAVCANNMQAVVMILDAHMSLGARAEELFSRKCAIPPQFQPLDSRLRKVLDEAYLKMVDELRELGAVALGTTWNRESNVSFAGISKGAVEIPKFVNRIFRKTGIMNALFAKEFYNKEPHRRPRRHTQHNPLPPIAPEAAASSTS
jgi:hypothetical protein